MIVSAMINLLPLAITVVVGILAGFVLISSGGKEYRLQMLLVVIAHTIYYIGGEVMDKLDSLIRLSAYALRIVERM